MSNSISFHVESAPNEHWRELVHAFLREFNQAVNPKYWSAREKINDARDALDIFARDEHGNVIAGLFGSTQFLWLRTEILAVAPQHRGTGIGRELMALAESEAKSRGCKYSYVETMSYEAPDFYAKLGYDIRGSIDNWDSHGHSKIYMVKEIG